MSLVDFAVVGSRLCGGESICRYPSPCKLLRLQMRRQLLRDGSEAEQNTHAFTSQHGIRKQRESEECNVS